MNDVAFTPAFLKVDKQAPQQYQSELLAQVVEVDIMPSFVDRDARSTTWQAISWTPELVVPSTLILSCFEPRVSPPRSKQKVTADLAVSEAQPQQHFRVSPVHHLVVRRQGGGL